MTIKSFEQATLQFALGDPIASRAVRLLEQRDNSRAPTARDGAYRILRRVATFDLVPIDLLAPIWRAHRNQWS